jgi:hypothetical protein
MLHKLWASNAVSAFGSFLVILAERTQRGMQVRGHADKRLAKPTSFGSLRRIWQNEPIGFNRTAQTAGFIHCFCCNSLNQNVFG